MKAPKNVFILISLFIGLAAIIAFAEETEDTCIWSPSSPYHRTAGRKLNLIQDTTADTIEVTAGDSMLLVKKVSFEGVKTTSEDMLRTLIQTQIGQEISEELLTQDLKSLFKDTGFFSELTVDVDTR